MRDEESVQHDYRKSVGDAEDVSRKNPEFPVIDFGPNVGQS